MQAGSRWGWRRRWGGEMAAAAGRQQQCWTWRRRSGLWGRWAGAGGGWGSTGCGRVAGLSSASQCLKTQHSVRFAWARARTQSRALNLTGTDPPTPRQGLLGVAEEPDEDEEECLGPWLALQQLVVKAFFQPETELLALEVLGALAAHVALCDAAAGRRTSQGRQAAAPAAAEDAAAAACDAAAAGGGADLFSCLSLADGLLLAAPDGRPPPAPIEAVLGDLEAGVAISLGAALPWLSVHLRDVGPEGVVESFLESTAGACTALGWPDLAAALAALAGMAGAAEEAEQWLPPLCTVRWSVGLGLPGMFCPVAARLHNPQPCMSSTASWLHHLTHPTLPRH